MKFYWYLVIAIGIMLGSVIFSSNVNLMPESTNHHAEIDGDCNFSTPREAVRTFLYNARNYNRDHYSGFGCIADVVTSQERKKYADYNTEVVEKAKKIFLVLENINYNINKDIPEDVTGNKISFVLFLKEQPVKFIMEKGLKGWRFSNEMFSDPTFLKVIKDLKIKYAKFTSENIEGDTYVQNLMSPFRTFFTLKSGVEGKGAESLERATAALDLSDYNSLERPVYGPILAVLVYRVISQRSTIQLEQLSADPDCDYPPVFLVVPDLGSVTMHVVTLDDGRKAWKFTPESLNAAWKSYDDTIDDVLKEGNNPFSGNKLPLHMVVDDFVHLNFPGLMVKYFNTNLYKWVILFGLFIITPVVLWLISRIVSQIIVFLDKKLPEGVDAPQRSSLAIPLEVIAVCFIWLKALSILILYNSVMTISLYGIKIIGSLSIVWISMVIINLFCNVLTLKGGAGIKGTMMLIIAQIFKVAIMLMWVVYVANLFGLNSTRIFAAMGIGGLAIALAGKDTLENIFGTMVIMTTRPFAVGDWINFLGMDGTVENVGVRSTSIRTFYNSELIIPNAKFISNPVDNMGRREWRRYKTIIGVAYDTPAENLNGYVQGLKKLVLNTPNTNKINFHIVVHDFGPSSIDIMVYIFFKTTDWAQELVSRHQFIVDALRLAEKMKITVAYPTTTVHLSQEQPKEYLDFQSDAHAESIGREFASVVRPVKNRE